ncbi:Dual oxidase maturation factor 1 [Orchesella cincta]|uniref:Dual oxidase maturation factor 1 n=1 Tax=Orchesella cincta TaxID=48709 RepID=A0A1D2NM15_ORCCI|nr:Dual oxidase maturation factor 1 [Orchesella cincta]
MLSKYGTGWHVADSSIMSYYRAFSRDKLAADIGVHVGLTHFNVTLQGLPSRNESLASDYLREDIDFNERFHWVSATDIHDEYREALVKGLPYPILTVVEYFSVDEEGFCWGRQYRLAGYYGAILLWASFASWLLMNLLLVVVPRYGAYQMVITGGLMLLTNALYYLLIPSKPLVIRFEDQFLMFKFGWCFWLVMIAGSLCFLVGAIISTVDLLYPHKFSTILEVDYGTPFDRHVIIEESHYTRRKKGSTKRSLEDPEPIGFGRKLLRTLSKRDRSEDGDGRLTNGVVNQGFQMDCPKSPWMYPHNMMYKPDGTPVRPALQNAFARNPALARLAAPLPTKSPKSVSFRRQSRLEQTFTVDPLRLKRSDSSDSTSSSSSSGIGRDQKEENQFKPIERTNSQQSGSSISSFGLGLLSRTESRRDPKGGVSGASGGIILPAPHKQPISTQPSGEDEEDPNHLPLARIQYKTKHMGIYQLPRASIERKSSSEEESSFSSPPSRRDSSNSEKSRSGSSGFSSTSFDLSSKQRPGPDGLEAQVERRSSNESVGSNKKVKTSSKDSGW